MSESEQQREASPLLSERGVTTISDTVVSQLAGMAAREVEGVHMGGGASRTASGVLGSITGSESKTSGISVEVGRTETAIDLKMGVEYNRNILQTVEEVRRRITDRIESMTGLRIKELNATITDITFPEKEQRRRIGSGTSTREDSTESTAADTAATESEPEVQTTPESEPAPDASESETTQVEATGSTADEPEEASTVEEGPPEESETAEVRTEEQPTDEVPEASEEAQETSAETEATQEVRAETPEEPEARPEPETPEEPETGPETPEPETHEARMRRRAEERARRRRSQDS